MILNCLYKILQNKGKTTLNLICARVIRNAEFFSTNYRRLRCGYGSCYSRLLYGRPFFFWNADWMNYLPLRMDGRDLFMFERAMVRNESERNATSSLQCLRYVVNRYDVFVGYNDDFLQ